VEISPNGKKQPSMIVSSGAEEKPGMEEVSNYDYFSPALIVSSIALL